MAQSLTSGHESLPPHVKSKRNIIINRIGLVLFILGIGGCWASESNWGYPWFHGVGLALIIIGSCLGNATIHDSKPSPWQNHSPDERDKWFEHSIQSLSTQQPVVTRLMLVNQLAREMNLPLDQAETFVNDYCHRHAPDMPLSDNSGFNFR